MLGRRGRLGWVCLWWVLEQLCGREGVVRCMEEREESVGHHDTQKNFEHQSKASEIDCTLYHHQNQSNHFITFTHKVAQ